MTEFDTSMTEPTPTLSAEERQRIEMALRVGEAVTTEKLRQLLFGPEPLAPGFRLMAAQALLRDALEQRDTEAAVLVTRLMDADPELDAAFAPILNEWLANEPDAVYALVRAHLNENLSPRWVERLQNAALLALQVVLTDSDAETVVNWLKLIAREPSSYGLGTLLYHSLLAAAERARTEPELGRVLIPIAIKRAPAALKTLLADEALLRAMQEFNLGRALFTYDGDALQLMNIHGPEVMSTVLSLAVKAKKGEMFHPVVVEQLWTLAADETTLNIPEEYQPTATVAAIAADSLDWLEPAAQQTLLMLALREHRDDLVLTLAGHLPPSDINPKLIAGAFQASGRSEADLPGLINILLGRGVLQPQQALDISLQLLNTWNWPLTALPVLQQVGRLIQQAPLEIETEALWHLLAQAAENRDDGLARTSARRLMSHFEALEDENELIEGLQRLFTLSQWHAPTKQAVILWWRSFLRETPLPRLQKLEKQFEGRKLLEDLRGTLQTVIAFRKLIGKRSLGQFAQDVSVAYNLLEALNDSFEPTTRRPFDFDPVAMREEWEARGEELSPHEQQIMASNFKEMAHMIAEMGDNRSKASLIRRSDNVDRQLMTGDQEPHSAVDALKWLAGYLSGTQDKGDEEVE